MKGMYSRLPHFVIIKNERITINTDFRIFIDFENEMQGNNQKEAIKKVLMRFYPAFFVICEKGLLWEAVDKFVWFYRCGKNEEEIKKKKGKTASSQIYSYKHDDLYIWGTFYQLYKVDLTKDKIHWWKFRAMWLTIPDNAIYSKIKGYRSYTGKDEEILELQEAYRLPITEKDIADKLRRDKIYELLK